MLDVTGWMDLAPSSPGRAALERMLVTNAPEALLADPSAEAAALRAAVRLLVAEARVVDPVRAERLVIALRRVWRDLLAADQRVTDGPHRALWDRLVALCVEEFYAPVPADRSVGRPSDAPRARPQRPYRP